MKHGYKQTEVGVIPEEWELKRLDALADIRSGGTPSTDEPRFWGGDIPWCTPTDVTALNGYKYLGETARMITKLGLKASSAEMIPSHSVVMTSRATIGECAINSVPVSTNQGFKNFIPFAATDVDFLYYLLGTQKQRFVSLCGGSTFLEIGKTQLSAFRVQFPPTKSEQRAIATTLSDVDLLLNGLERLIAKKRNLKQAAMQQLLTGRTRLLGFKGEWESVRFERLCATFTKQTGFDYTTHIKPTLITEKRPDFLPFIQNKDFEGARVNLDTDYYIPERVAVMFPTILLDKPCLLISISGKIGNVGVFSSTQPAFIGGAVAVAKFIDSTKLDWTMFYLQSEDGQKKLRKDVKAGSHQNLILEDIRKLIVPMPLQNERSAITSLLRDIDDEIFELQRRYIKTENIKQAMMQELLTGKTRLVATEAACV